MFKRKLLASLFHKFPPGKTDVAYRWNIQMQKLTALKGKAIYQYKHTRDARFYGKVMKKN